MYNTVMHIEESGLELFYFKLVSGETVMGYANLSMMDIPRTINLYNPMLVLDALDENRAEIRLLPWVPELMTLSIGFSVMLRYDSIMMMCLAPSDISIYYTRMIERYRNATPDIYANCHLTSDQKNTNH
jgi:hypothetical protein